MENLWYLQDRDFFAGLEEQRQRFLQRAILKTLPKNDIVFFEGDTGDSCFYVASGLVRIFSITDSGKESIFFLRRPGELFGLSEVLNAFPRRANAQTLMPTELYAMPSVEFDSLLAEDYVLARRVITMLGSRVRYLGDRLSNLATGSVMSRLIKLLISLVYDLLPDAEAWAKPVALPVRISQEQLASMTGSTQPTVSDLLQKLHKAGLIAIAHKSRYATRSTCSPTPKKSSRTERRSKGMDGYPHASRSVWTRAQPSPHPVCTCPSLYRWASYVMDAGRTTRAFSPTWR